MSINIKKYTKEQMAKMVEEAQEEAQTATAYEKQWREQIDKMGTRERDLRAKNAALTEQLDQMNGEAINKANEIANLKADADALRNNLADTEATLRRVNDEFAFQGAALTVMRDGRYNAEQRANYAENHPWRNLWAWVKRKLGCKA